MDLNQIFASLSDGDKQKALNLLNQSQNTQNDTISSLLKQRQNTKKD